MPAVKTVSRDIASENSGLIQQINDINHLEGGLIPALHIVQERYGYLPEETLKIVSDKLNVSMAQIYGVATFYSFFSLVPKGEHTIRVCLGTACYVKEAQKFIDKLSDKLNIKIGETTADGKFSLEASRCLGACGIAPAMMIGEDVHGKLTEKKLKEALDKYKSIGSREK